MPFRRLGLVQHAPHQFGVDQHRRLAEGENPALDQRLRFGIQDSAPGGTLQAPPNDAGGVGFHSGLSSLPTVAPRHGVCAPAGGGYTARLTPIPNQRREPA